MRNHGVIAVVTVTSLSDEGERVTKEHKYQAPDEVQRKAREAVDRWCAAIWIAGVTVKYVGGRVEAVKVPWWEQKRGDDDGLEGTAV